MDLVRLFSNGWCVLAFFIACWCISDIIKNIVYSRAIVHALKILKDIPDDQRSILIDQAFGKIKK